MALTNCYATLAEVAMTLDIPDAGDDPKLDIAINAASRQIDGHTGRRFWQDGTVVARTYTASETRWLATDDISTVTGLIVKIDTDVDVTFETTLTISTDFVLEPSNAAAEYPVQPFTAIRLVGDYTYPTSSYGRPTVQVTAKYGWSAVPEDVKDACILQARTLYKAPAATFGAFGVDSGTPMRIRSLDQVAEALLARYRKVEC
jgi:hypothetical protein